MAGRERLCHHIARRMTAGAGTCGAEAHQRRALPLPSPHRPRCPLRPCSFPFPPSLWMLSYITSRLMPSHTSKNEQKRTRDGGDRNGAGNRRRRDVIGQRGAMWGRCRRSERQGTARHGRLMGGVAPPRLIGAPDQTSGTAGGASGTAAGDSDAALPYGGIAELREK